MTNEKHALQVEFSLLKPNFLYMAMVIKALVYKYIVQESKEIKSCISFYFALNSSNYGAFTPAIFSTIA